VDGVIEVEGLHFFEVEEGEREGKRKVVEVDADFLGAAHGVHPLPDIDPGDQRGLLEDEFDAVAGALVSRAPHALPLR